MRWWVNGQAGGRRSSLITHITSTGTGTGTPTHHSNDQLLSAWHIHGPWFLVCEVHRLHSICRSCFPYLFFIFFFESFPRIHRPHSLSSAHHPISPHLASPRLLSFSSFCTAHTSPPRSDQAPPTSLSAAHPPSAPAVEAAAHSAALQGNSRARSRPSRRALLGSSYFAAAVVAAGEVDVAVVGEVVGVAAVGEVAAAAATAVAVAAVGRFRAGTEGCSMRLRVGRGARWVLAAAAAVVGVVRGCIAVVRRTAVAAMCSLLCAGREPGRCRCCSSSLRCRRRRRWRVGLGTGSPQRVAGDIGSTSGVGAAGREVVGRVCQMVVAGVLRRRCRRRG